jgi:hypothetical protein
VTDFDVPVIGLIPAAGKSTRIHGLPKFLLPVPGDEHLLGRTINWMHAADAEPIIIGSSPENIQLVARFAETKEYRVAETVSMNDTLLRMRDSRSGIYLLGMPDTYFDDFLIGKRIVEHLRVNGHFDVVVGLWPIRSEQRGQLGQCEIDDTHVVKVVDKDPDCPFRWSWGIIAWKTTFWDFIKRDDPHAGYALQPAIDAGLRVGYVLADGKYWDCGTISQYWDFATLKRTSEMEEAGGRSVD